MGKSKPIIFLGAGIIVALLTSFITYEWLRDKTEIKTVNAPKTQKIAVAAVDIARGKVMQKEMIKFVPYLSESIPNGSFNEASSLEGRVVVTSLAESEPIIETKLAQKGSSGGVAAIVSPKKRAMAVKVDKVIGVSGFIHPGNRVDVLVTMKPQWSKYPVTKTVLENVLVLAAGTKIEQTGKNEKPAKVDVITLEVDPNEAEKLALASTEGKIQLAIRSYQDTEDFLTTGTTKNSLLASYTPRARKTYKRSGFTVEVIKGSSVEKVKLKRR